MNENKTYLLTFFLLLIVVLNTPAQQWKIYPYQPEESSLIFPRDEGFHPEASMEWWYLNAHTIGLTSNSEYDIMLTYFYSANLAYQGYRIFNIANNSTNHFNSQSIYCNYDILSPDFLHIKIQPDGEMNEWLTIKDDQGQLVPFEYRVSAKSDFNSFQAELKSEKRPLLIGQTGFVYQGTGGYSSYYSQTKLKLTGTLELNNETEEIIGTAWIDHQYGDLLSTVNDKYEWFSIQLSNGMDLNIWNIFKDSHILPDSPANKICSIYLGEDKDTTVSDFELNRLKYFFIKENSVYYAQKWRFTWENIDLIITANHHDRVLLSPKRFYEGSTDIYGTVNGKNVSGKGFAELLHTYESPKVKFSDLVEHDSPNDILTINWQLLNPDDGRPIWYDFKISNNNGMTFTTAVQKTSATSVTLSKSKFNINDNSLLKITGYSIDSTLSGSDIISVKQLKNNSELQSEFYLLQNFPNPFNANTIIKFYLPTESNISLSLFNSLGELVDVMASGNYKAGVHEILFDANRFASGIYYYMLKANSIAIYKKMILMK